VPLYQKIVFFTDTYGVAASVENPLARCAPYYC
jgi:hypothetical protein